MSPCTATYRADDQDDHQDGLRKRRNIAVPVPSQEEQSTQANLLDVDPNKDMGDCFREKQTASIPGSWLILDPDENVLENNRGEKEEKRAESVDDGRNDIENDRHALWLLVGLIPLRYHERNSWDQQCFKPAKQEPASEQSTERLACSHAHFCDAPKQHVD